MIALFSATKLECDLILRNLHNKKYMEFKGLPFFTGKISNTHSVVSITGIGKINSSIASVMLLNLFKVSKIIILGVAGGYPSSNLSLGEIVFCEKEVDAERGILVDCKNSDTPFIFLDYEEIDMHIPDAFKNFKKGIFLTVDCCSGTLRRAKFLEKNFNAICENMEGAAIAKAAKLFSIPAIEIRSVSNIITDRESLLTTEEIKSAAAKVQMFILENFLELTNQS